MELVEGKPLGDIISNEGALSGKTKYIHLSLFIESKCKRITR
jgi:hypothetical protein